LKKAKPSPSDLKKSVGNLVGFVRSFDSYRLESIIYREVVQDVLMTLFYSTTNDEIIDEDEMGSLVASLAKND
jgi:hypothetical protein